MTVQKPVLPGSAVSMTSKSGLETTAAVAAFNEPHRKQPSRELNKSIQSRFYLLAQPH